MTKISLLTREATGLIIVDIQERLMQVMGNPDRVTDRIVKLLHLSRLFFGAQGSCHQDDLGQSFVQKEVYHPL